MLGTLIKLLVLTPLLVVGAMLFALAYLHDVLVKRPFVTRPLLARQYANGAASGTRDGTLDSANV